MVDEEILNRRLIQENKIVYPITQQQNVIGLQKTITDKLPIVSSETPASGTYVEKQVWLDTSEDDGAEVEVEPVISLRSSPMLKGAKRGIVATAPVQEEDELFFPSRDTNEVESGELFFPSDETIEKEQETKPKEEEER